MGIDINDNLKCAVGKELSKSLILETTNGIESICEKNKEIKNSKLNFYIDKHFIFKAMYVEYHNTCDNLFSYYERYKDMMALDYYKYISENGDNGYEFFRADKIGIEDKGYVLVDELGGFSFIKDCDFDKEFIPTEGNVEGFMKCVRRNEVYIACKFNPFISMEEFYKDTKMVILMNRFYNISVIEYDKFVEDFIPFNINILDLLGDINIVGEINYWITGDYDCKFELL